MKNKRDLDGVYFRVKRGDKWENVCFSDLETEEQDMVMQGRPETWFKSMCKILADTIYTIGEQLDIVGAGHSEDD